MAAARGEQRGLVGEIREVRADHPGRALGNGVEVDVFGQWDRARVHFEDLAAPVAIRRLHGDAPVEAPRAQERGVEDVRTVRGGEHDDGL